MWIGYTWRFLRLIFFFSNFPSRRSSFKDVSLAVLPLLTSKICIVNAKTGDCQYAIGG